MLRRYFLISLIVFERYLTTVQVLGYLTLSTLMLAYILHARPYKKPLYNKVELFNETCVYITGWFILLQTETFGFSAETRYDIGWGQIGIAFAVIVLGVVLMIGAHIYICKLKCRRRFYRKILKREQLAELELANARAI